QQTTSSSNDVRSTSCPSLSGQRDYRRPSTYPATADLPPGTDATSARVCALDHGCGPLSSPRASAVTRFHQARLLPVRLSPIGAGTDVCRATQVGVDEFGFDVGEALVEEPVVGVGGVQLLLQTPVVFCELPNSLLEYGVLLSEALGGAFGVLGLQVADLPEEDADPFALSVDLGVCGLEGVLGVEGALMPGRFALRVVCGLGAAALVAAGGDRGGHQVLGVGVLVEEGARDAGPPGD